MKNCLNDPSLNDESLAMYDTLASIRSLEAQRMEFLMSGKRREELNINLQLAFRKGDLQHFLN